MPLVFLLYALFASVFTISKVGLEYTQPFFFVGSRMALAGFLMLLFQYLFRRGKFQVNKQHIWLIVKLGIFNIYLTNVYEFWVLKYLTSFKTCFIYSLSPFLSALFSYFILSEKLSTKKWIGLTIGFLGLMPILLSQGAAESEVGSLLFFSWAELSVMSAAVCSVYGWILLRKCVNEGGYSPFMANGMSMLIGGAIALCHSLAVEEWHPIPVTNLPTFLECTLLLILISNMICYNLYGQLLKKFTATFMSFAGFTTPFFTALFGWIVLSEVVGWPFFLSSIGVLTGLTIFYMEELKQGYLQPQEVETSRG